MPHPMKIVQTPALVVLLYETSTNQTFRQVFLDGRPFPADPQPTWLGYSIGRWEGDTLVVETTGFNGRAWVDTGSGHPQTDADLIIAATALEHSRVLVTGNTTHFAWIPSLTLENWRAP